MKGPAGWQHSTVASAALEDAIPDADDNCALQGENDYLSATCAATDELPDVPLSDQADVEYQANGWTELWQEGSQ